MIGPNGFNNAHAPGLLARRIWGAKILIGSAGLSQHLFSGDCRRRFSWQETGNFKILNSVQEVRAMNSVERDVTSSALLYDTRNLLFDASFTSWEIRAQIR